MVIPLTSMLKSICVDLLAIDYIVCKHCIIDEINNSKVNRAKVSEKMAQSKSNDKSKGKNLIKFFLVKALTQETSPLFF